MAFKFLGFFTLVALTVAEPLQVDYNSHQELKPKAAEFSYGYHGPQQVAVGDQLTYKAVEYESVAPAAYDFNYDVHDEHTGDIKSQRESRNGDTVQGRYELIDSDGFRRIVEYTADGHNGFIAVVHREPVDYKIPQPLPQQQKLVYATPTVKAVPTQYQYPVNQPVYYTPKYSAPVASGAAFTRPSQQYYTLPAQYQYNQPALQSHSAPVYSSNSPPVALYRTPVQSGPTVQKAPNYFALAHNIAQAPIGQVYSTPLYSATAQNTPQQGYNHQNYESDARSFAYFSPISGQFNQPPTINKYYSNAPTNAQLHYAQFKAIPIKISTPSVVETHPRPVQISATLSPYSTPVPSISSAAIKLDTPNNEEQGRQDANHGLQQQHHDSIRFAKKRSSDEPKH